MTYEEWLASVDRVVFAATQKHLAAFATEWPMRQEFEAGTPPSEAAWEFLEHAGH
jgi:hypothetical protein